VAGSSPAIKRKVIEFPAGVSRKNLSETAGVLN
jgi:hypothetical protein